MHVFCCIKGVVAVRHHWRHDVFAGGRDLVRDWIRRILFHRNWPVKSVSANGKSRSNDQVTGFARILLAKIAVNTATAPFAMPILAIGPELVGVGAVSFGSRKSFNRQGG